MLIFAPPDLCLLADTYCALTGKSQAALIDEMGVNDKLFRRLAAGMGCHSDTLMQASRWFIENWPEGAAWPTTICRPEPREAA
jgi:hypothetical protein